jgi:hypothetical protein
MLFKNIGLSSILLLIYAATVFSQKIDSPEITSAEIKEHISFLASDELKGRDSVPRNSKQIYC